MVIKIKKILLISVCINFIVIFVVIYLVFLNKNTDKEYYITNISDIQMYLKEKNFYNNSINFSGIDVYSLYNLNLSDSEKKIVCVSTFDSSFYMKVFLFSTDKNGIIQSVKKFDTPEGVGKNSFVFKNLKIKNEDFICLYNTTDRGLGFVEIYNLNYPEEIFYSIQLDYLESNFNAQTIDGDSQYINKEIFGRMPDIRIIDLNNDLNDDIIITGGFKKYRYYLKKNNYKIDDIEYFENIYIFNPTSNSYDKKILKDK